MSSAIKKVGGHPRQQAINNDNSHHEPVWGWLQSKPAYAIWCHAMEDWRKEGKDDPMLLEYPSRHTAEEAKRAFEADYGVPSTVMGSVIIVEPEHAVRLEKLFDKERIQHMFAGKLRAALQHWRNSGEPDTITMEFATPQEVFFAWEELYTHFGIQGMANEEETFLEIPSHYAGFITQHMEMSATPAKGKWTDRIRGSMGGQRLSLA